MTGTLGLSVVTLPQEVWQPSEDLLERMTAFNFSKKITQYHCTICGALTLSSSSRPGQKLEWDILSGMLDKFDNVADLRGHIFVPDTIDGGFTDFLRTWQGKRLGRYVRFTDGEEEPVHPGTHATASITLHEQRLHGYCKCKGVEFWIVRPSAASARALPEDAWWLRENGTKYLADNCICNSCRLASGVEVTQWAYVPTQDISLDSQGKVPFRYDFGTMKAYQSSPDATRYYCKICGATAFYRRHSREGVINVGIGLLDATEGARAETWLHWLPGPVDFHEDALGRADGLLQGLEEGLRLYAENRPGYHEHES